MPLLRSVNVGLPRDVAWHGETVHTGIWKQPVTGRTPARRLNLDGDGQGDLGGHGGEQRAIMVYQIDSYRYWEEQLGRHDFTFGQFSENFTVDGLPDDEVCIGDRYRIGGAIFEVTQPRVTCYRIGIRMNEPKMPSLLVAHHRPGFYLRVIEEGLVGPGDEITKIAEAPERVSVAEIDALLYLPGHRREAIRRALRVPALSPGWKNSFQALLDQGLESSGGNAGLTSVTAPPSWPGFRALRVAKVDRESAAVVSLILESPDGSPLPSALPGQFLTLRLRTTTGTPPLLRNYSLSSAPGDAAYRVSIKREEKGVGSGFVHEHIKAGDAIDVAAPRGNFTLRAGEAPVVLLSAGIGATPVMAMLHALATAATQREVWWIYGARDRVDHPFASESRALLRSLARGHRYIAYSRPSPEDRQGEDYDATGRLDLAALEKLGVPRGADFYLCGPPSFLSGFTAALKQWGVPLSKIYTENFGPEAPITPGIAGAPRKTPHPPSGAPGTGPQISFTRSGLTVPWNSTYHSLLDFAEACDVSVRWSCRTGVCHTCGCALIGGAVQYEPEPLEPPSQGNVLICCATPKQDLELDL